jgi:hypothetical protein
VAIFTTIHHSLFMVIGEDVTTLLRWFKAQFLDGLSSGATASATPPSCAGKAAAQSDYTVQSTAGPTVYWCFGMDSTGQRILRVVNNRRYPMEIQHPALTVTEKPTIDYASLASLSHLISGRDSILAPGAQIGYRVSLPAGQKGGANTALDGFGQSLFALQTGINALLEILTRFGVGGASKSITVMNDALGDAACADALGSGKPGAILASCFSPKDLVDDFGSAGWLLAPLAAVGALAAFFASEFQALHDVWTNRDQYVIAIDHVVMPAAPPCTGSAIQEAARSAVGQLGATLQKVASFQCSGGFAYAFANVGDQGNINSVTLLFKASGTAWTYVNRDTYCEDHSVPKDIYFNACETQ